MQILESALNLLQRVLICFSVLSANKENGATVHCLQHCRNDATPKSKIYCPSEIFSNWYCILLIRYLAHQSLAKLISRAPASDPDINIYKLVLFLPCYLARQSLLNGVTTLQSRDDHHATKNFVNFLELCTVWQRY